MRGDVERQVPMLTLTTPDQRVPKDHPIRRIKQLADTALRTLSPVFDRMYSERGRPSIPPETLLKSCLLIALYSVRSERQFCEVVVLKAILKDVAGLASVTWDGSGNAGGIVLDIQGGDRYCATLGGAAGGAESLGPTLTITNATSEPGCLCPKDPFVDTREFCCAVQSGGNFYCIQSHGYALDKARHDSECHLAGGTPNDGHCESSSNLNCVVWAVFPPFGCGSVGGQAHYCQFDGLNPGHTCVGQDICTNDPGTLQSLCIGKGGIWS